MSRKLDEVEVDEDNHSPEAALQPRSTSSDQGKSGCAKFLETTTNILADPTFIEILVVVIVIVSAVLTSELGIYAGKSYHG